jgi:hypothetical protein
MRREIPVCWTAGGKCAAWERLALPDTVGAVCTHQVRPSALAGYGLPCGAVIKSENKMKKELKKEL